MEEFIASIPHMPAPQLQRVATRAARCGEPLIAMHLLKALAVRCAGDSEALMHVCTALNVDNDFYTLYTLLNCCIDCDDFFALFACVQHAYGTRVYRGVACNGVINCVCVVTMYRVCVLSVDGAVVTVLHNIVLRDVDVREDDGCVVCGALSWAQPPAGVVREILVLQDRPLPADLPPLVYPPFQRRVLLAWDAPILDAASALKELHEVPPPPAPLHLPTLNPKPHTFSGLVPSLHTRVVHAGGARVSAAPFGSCVWQQQTNHASQR